MQKIIVATKNEGKVKEIKALLYGCGFDIKSLKDEGIDLEIEETGSTFEENSLIKARAIHNLTGDIVIADDSGLEIDFLNGDPGIHSARFMADLPYTERNKRIIELLKDVPEERRTARFRCVASLVSKSIEKTYTGTIEGRIAYEAKGDYGFGYDPIFFVPEYNLTLAQIDPEIKNQISHRSRAFRLLAQDIKKMEIL
ncbi:MAG: RdgB/HAM1 family non-canonical purine NTP pyrophosphatase [Clostridiaceae bacterium]|nr:RdgB/HAM1 family non-canonical purine NTP pyrophosphatase [Clostridiaceae bacterium]